MNFPDYQESNIEPFVLSLKARDLRRHEEDQVLNWV